MIRLTEVPADDWYRRLADDTPGVIIDVRTPEDAAAWPVPAPAHRVRVIQGSRILNGELAVLALLPPPGTPFSVICGQGVSSAQVAFTLAKLGYDARSVAGGMAALSRLLVPRAVNAGPGAGIVQFDRVGKGCLSYLVVQDGEAVVIDPTVDPDPFLAAAREHGARIAAVVDTHLHADHVSVGRRLAAAGGAPYWMQQADSPDLAEGGPLPAGLEVLATPGHTTNSVALVLGSRAVFTGDTLFVAGVGRPDLGGHADDWVHLLYRSLERLRAAVDPGALVLPAHFGSETERNPDGTVGRPLAEVADRNATLSLPPAEFAAHVLNTRPAQPDNFAVIREINAGLMTVSPADAAQLETGPNRCAVGH